MNAFRGKLLASGATLHCSMSMYDRFNNWMGDKSGQQSQQNGQQQQQNNSQQNNNNNQQQNANGQQQQQQGSQQNGGGGDGIDINKIWDSVQSADNQQQQQQNNNNANNQNNNQQQQQATPEERVAQYLKGQGLDPIVLNDQDKEDLKGGNFDNVMARINEKIANSHIKSVQATQTLIKNEVTKAVKEATDNSRSYVDGLDSRKLLENDPDLKTIAADGIFGPNVQAIFKQFMDKPGATKDKALAATKQYFKTMLQKFDPNAQVNNNRGGPFRTPQNSGDTNWLDMLRGQDQSQS